MCSPKCTSLRVCTSAEHKSRSHTNNSFIHRFRSCSIFSAVLDQKKLPLVLWKCYGISQRCDTFQRVQNAPSRFTGSFGAENVRFNERIPLDIVYIDGKPVLHIVDEVTHFSAAQFRSDVSTKTIWATILKFWAPIYTGLPNRMLVNQGSAFRPLFIIIGAVSNVQVNRTWIEAHSSL